MQKCTLLALTLAVVTFALSSPTAAKPSHHALKKAILERESDADALEFESQNIRDAVGNWTRTKRQTYSPYAVVRDGGFNVNFFYVSQNFHPLNPPYNRYETTGLAYQCGAAWRRGGYRFPSGNAGRMASAGLERSRPRMVEGVRLDLQGKYWENGVEYLNIQLQLNIDRAPGTSTTIAQVSIPSHLAYRVPTFVLRALNDSLRSMNGVKITYTRI